MRVVRPMMRGRIFRLKPLAVFFDGIANLIFQNPAHFHRRQDQLTSEDILCCGWTPVPKPGVLKQQEHYLIENIFDMQSRTVLPPP